MGNVAAASQAGGVGLFVLADDTDVLLWPGLGDVAVHASRMALREPHGSLDLGRGATGTVHRGWLSVLFFFSVVFKGN